MESKASKTGFQVFDRWAPGDADRIRNTLMSISGVIDVTADQRTQRITVTYNSSDRSFPHRLHQALYGLGYKRVYRL